ncbi:MAG: PAS domain S-box protein [Desulfovibrio sp.]|nr:MAG: PAS domain S-box protein [Desulfovibrio sp.]
MKQPETMTRGELAAEVERLRDVEKRYSALLESKDGLASEKEELNELLLSSLSGAVFTADAQARFDYVCKYCSQIFGYDTTEVAAMGTVESLFGPGLYDLDQIRREKEIHFPDWKTNHKSGKPVVLDITIKEISLGNAVVLIACHDVTEKAAAEQGLLVGRGQIEKQLAELDHIYQTAPIGMAVFDTDLRYVRVNQKLAEINGKSIKEHIGHTLHEVLPQISHEVEPVLRSIMQTGLSVLGQEVEGESAAKPGMTINCLADYYPIRTPDGEIFALGATVMEITERKKAEHALKLSEERYRALSEDLPAMVCEFQPDSTLTYVNAMYCEFFGSSVEKLVGKRFLDFVPEEDKERVKNGYLVLTPENSSNSIVHEVLTSNEKLYQEWTNRAFFTPEGQIVKYQAVGLDVTARVLAETALKESEYFLKMLETSSPTGLYVFDLEAERNVYVNTGYTSILGYDLTSYEAMSNEDMSDLFHPDDLPSLSEHMGKLSQAAEGDVFELEYRFLHKSGNWIWCLSRDTPFKFGEQGQVLQFMGTFVDITDRKASEIALAKSEQEYRDIFDSVTDCLFIADFDGNVINANRAACETYGYTAEEIMDLAAVDLIHPVHLGKFNQYVAQLHETGRFQGKTLDMRKDGTTFPTEARGTLVDYRGSPHMLAVITDVTERVENEKVMADNEKRLEILLRLGLMTGEPDQPILDFALSAVADLTHSELGSVMLVGPKEKMLTPWAWLNQGMNSGGIPPEPSIREYPPKGVWKVALERREPVISNGSGSEVPQGSGAEKGGPMQGFLVVPIFDANRIVLLAGVANKAGDYIDEDVKLVSIIMSEAWRVIRQNRAISEDHLHRERFETLFTLSQMQDAGVEEINTYALEEAVRLTGSKAGYLHYIDSDQETIHLNIWSGDVAKECEVSTGLHYPMEKAGIWADCVRQGGPVIHNDYQNEPDKKGYPEGHFPVVRHMSVPIYLDGKIQAILGVGNKEQPYTEFDVLQLNLFLDGLFKITREKQARDDFIAAQDALEASEKKYRSLLVNLHEGIWEIDKDSNTVFVNQAMADMLGYAPEEMLGKQLFNFMEDEVVELSEQHIELRKQGVAETYDFAYLHKEGHVVQTVISANPLVDEQGNHSGSVAVITDVTDRRKAEEAVRDLARFPSENPNPVMRVDTEGMLLYANQASRVLLGHWKCEMGERLPPNILELCLNALKSGRNILMDLDTGNFQFGLTFAPVVDSGYLNIYGQDITIRKKVEEALVVSRERLEMALSASELGMWDWNLLSGSMLFDKTLLAMIGYEPGELPSDESTFWDLIHPEDKETTATDIQRAKQGNQIYKSEFRLQTKTGGWKWILAVGKMVERDSSGAPLRMVGVHLDISDRKEREHRLRKNLQVQGALSRLYELLVGQNTTLKEISNALYEESLMLTRAEYALCATLDPETQRLRPHTFDTIFGEQCAMDSVDKDCISPPEAATYPGLWGYPLNENLSFYTNEPEQHAASTGLPQGHVPIRQFLAVPVVLGERRAGLIALANKEDGFNANDLACVEELARYYGLAIQGMEARRMFTESEERYRTLVESMQEGIFMLNDKGAFTYVNHQLCKMLGLSRSEVLGKACADFIDPAETDHLLEQLASRRQGGSEKYELTFLNREGDKVFCLVSPTPLFDDEGDFIGSLGVVTNITEHKLLEAQLLQAQKLESIGQLAAGIAHEINTPVQYVDNNIRFLQDSMEGLLALITVCADLEHAEDEDSAEGMPAEFGPLLRKYDYSLLAEELPEALSDSLEGLERISKIVQSVKQLAHPGKQDRDYLDLNEAVRSTVTVSTNEWKYAADLDMDLDESLPLVPGFKAELNQVILNLIINAAHTIQEKLGSNPDTRGTITIATKHLGDKAQIQVSDTGMGIPEEIRTKVFDPFFTTKDVGKGSGQGLAISYSVIRDKHGGDIALDSEEGVGTTFTITLPLENTE